MKKTSTSTAFVTLVTLVIALLISTKTFACAGDYVGTIVVSDTTINVPMYYYGTYERMLAQAKVDEYNAAVYQDFSAAFDKVVSPLIADHWNHGFDQLYNVEVDKSTATIYYADETVRNYICREVDRNGCNNDENILNSSMQIAELKYDPSWIILYTCNPEGWWSITLTYWEPIN